LGEHRVTRGLLDGFRIQIGRLCQQAVAPGGLFVPGSIPVVIYQRVLSREAVLLLIPVSSQFRGVSERLEYRNAAVLVGVRGVVSQRRYEMVRKDSRVLLVAATRGRDDYPAGR